MVSKAKYPMYEMQENVVVVYGAFKEDGSTTGISPSGIGYNFFKNGTGIFTFYFDKYGDSTTPTEMKILYASAYCNSGDPFVPHFALLSIDENEITIVTIDDTGAVVDPLGDICIRAAILYSNAQV